MTSFLLVIIYDDKGVSKMEVYVELTYCMNGILFIMTYEMISLLLNINWSFLKILFLSFLSNISVILIYIDYLPYISFLYWIVLFLFIFLIDHQAQGEKYNSDNSKILDNFSESIGKDFVMYFEIFSIICVPVYL